MTAELRGGRRHDPSVGLSEPGPQQVSRVQYWTEPDRNSPAGFGAMVAELRAFLDHIAAGIANSGGSCDGQVIVPDGDHYRCWCSCGVWTVEAPDQAEGVRLARMHTAAR